MKIKLCKNHLEFLKSHLRKDRPDLFEYLNQNVVLSVFEIDDYNADAIHDWLGDQLQLIGFNEDYDLTEKGKVIDEIVDIFYGK
ncbi:MAG: hypothetical protein ACYC2U_07115 [Candidatus Amoebophilus sp.]